MKRNKTTYNQCISIASGHTLTCIHQLWVMDENETKGEYIEKQDKATYTFCTSNIYHITTESARIHKIRIPVCYRVYFLRCILYFQPWCGNVVNTKTLVRFDGSTLIRKYALYAYFYLTCTIVICELCGHFPHTDCNQYTYHLCTDVRLVDRLYIISIAEGCHFPAPFLPVNWIYKPSCLLYEVRFCWYIAGINHVGFITE